MDVIARIAACAFDRFAQLAADQFGGSRFRIGFMELFGGGSSVGGDVAYEMCVASI